MNTLACFRTWSWCSRQMNEPPGARFRVGHAALTMAEYFRDDQPRDVLLLIDNIFRVHPGRMKCPLDGQMPSRLGYHRPWHRAVEVGKTHRQYRYRRHHLIQAVYVRRTIHRSSAVHTFSHLSASIVLSRKRGKRRTFSGHRPLQSNSKMATPGIVGARHYGFGAGNPAKRSRNMLNSRTSFPCWALSSFRRETAMSSPVPPSGAVPHPAVFYDQRQFTGLDGKLVSLADALDGCERIARRIQGLSGECAPT